MKKKVIGIAAGLILLAAAGGYAGVGHYYASHFFPKTAINGLNCAGLTAEQVLSLIHISQFSRTPVKPMYVGECRRMDSPGDVKAAAAEATQPSTPFS